MDTMIDDWQQPIVEMANANQALMDGTIGPVQRIIDSAEIVFAVWQDPDAPHGVGMLLIKGKHRLKAIAAGDNAAPPGTLALSISTRCRVNAVACVCAEQAEALRQELGDK
jgi:hypothetical protein